MAPTTNTVVNTTHNRHQNRPGKREGGKKVVLHGSDDEDSMVMRKSEEIVNIDVIPSNEEEPRDVWSRGPNNPLELLWCVAAAHGTPRSRVLFDMARVSYPEDVLPKMKCELETMGMGMNAKEENWIGQDSEDDGEGQLPNSPSHSREKQKGTPWPWHENVRLAKKAKRAKMAKKARQQRHGQ
ncbi:hypothetical protein DXG01_004319 [Tephrocybe rancida]|nr:hypothetical protein DXG01_004319 [Tephrocybe rancida]